MLPLWSSLHLGDCLEEEEEAAVSEGGQTGEVDGVEDGDLKPGEWRPREEGPVVRIVEEILEFLPPSPVPALRFDGSSSQLFLRHHLELGYTVSVAGLRAYDWRESVTVPLHVFLACNDLA